MERRKATHLETIYRKEMEKELAGQSGAAPRAVFENAVDTHKRWKERAVDTHKRWKERLRHVAAKSDDDVGYDADASTPRSAKTQKKREREIEKTESDTERRKWRRALGQEEAGSAPKIPRLLRREAPTV
jgi:hypothetical protein